MTREALYVYALLADPPPGVEPRGEGIDGAPLRLVRAEDCGLAALVHEAPAHPYQGPDDEVRRWIRAHDEAVESMRRAVGGVLPMTFNVLVAPGPDGDAASRLRAWLRQSRDDLRARLDRLHGHAEYRVEIALESAAVPTGDPSVREIEERMRDSPPGMRRLLGRQLEARRRAAAESLADELHADARRRLGAIAEDLADRRAAVRRPEETEVLSLAVLVHDDEVENLGLVLSELQEGHPAVRVRFLGPWPPYSFTGDELPTPDAAENARSR
ncbi:GvpL/GvpF family gas vesicle protein [Actinomadura mexicana]|uniref:Gas vesicle synthesis protein GvpL/GvpF n=1 Tax=Actinomadura mexicana TaxID=134959 RepID=A0A238YLL1_9ACTN|nr:GvpL/GvpF family gas vesicle protein [Actinomadura mexicana]SNR71591.1 Gas vesicle synthesis protein GvpL/GvpF [Actinomadura mexicana]